MSPVPSLVLAAACTTANSYSKGTSYKSSSSEAASTNSGSTSAFPSSILETDHSPPTAIAAMPTPSSAQSSIANEQAMSGGTKIGLGLIPVVILICVIWILIIFSWRDLKMRKANTRQASLPLQSKDDIAPIRPLVSSPTYSNTRCSQICSIVAISAPNRNVLHRETSVLVESGPNDQASGIWPEEQRRIKARVVRFQHPALRCMDHVSPVDGASPFRLKPTTMLSMKRNTLGSEISILWPAPSPPLTVWTKNPDRFHQASTPVPVQSNYF